MHTVALFEDTRGSISKYYSSHAQGKIGFRCLYEKMIMGIHQAIGMTKPIVSLNSVAEDIEKVFTIPAITEYNIPGIPPCCYVIYRSRIFNA